MFKIIVLIKKMILNVSRSMAKKKFKVPKADVQYDAKSKDISIY
jgi:hypothetical protein